jgi:formate dehydrogenase iron-sulfur subunit
MSRNLLCPYKIGATQSKATCEAAAKCDLCLERLRQGQAPACSLVCHTGCITWGDTKSLLDKVAIKN